ncbi:hypothetical protein BDR26DRAFT_849565 [Obelidium mucronatum]|nr:hypothetical protein BDR26DRAFT_849565 [Obelidium mucronatum]
MHFSSAVAVILSALVLSADAIAHKKELVQGIARSAVSRREQNPKHSDVCSDIAAACIKNCGGLTDVACIRPCVKHSNICEKKRCKAYKLCAEPCSKNSTCIMQSNCLDELQHC